MTGSELAAEIRDETDSCCRALLPPKVSSNEVYSGKSDTYYSLKREAGSD